MNSIRRAGKGTGIGSRARMSSVGDLPGVPREIVAVWLLLAAVTIEVFVTYARLVEGNQRLVNDVRMGFQAI